MLFFSMNEMSWYSNNIKFNDDDENVLDQFRACIELNDIKGMRELMRSYAVFNQLDTRKLNKLFKIPGYKFTKRNDQLTLYKPITKTMLTSHSDENESVNVNEGFNSSDEQDEQDEQDEHEQDEHEQQQQPNNFVIDALNEIRQEIEHNKKELQQQHGSLIHAIEQKLSEITNVLNQHSQTINNILQIPQVPLQQEKYIDKRLYSYLDTDKPHRFNEQKPMSAYATQQPKPKPSPTNTAAAFREQLRLKQQQEELAKTTAKKLISQLE